MLVVLPACGECATMGVFSIWCLCHEAQAVEIFVHNAFMTKQPLHHSFMRLATVAARLLMFSIASQ